MTWASFAEAFASGALPEGARAAVGCGAVAGALVALAERRWGARAPSATALGMGMLLPGEIAASVLVGSLVARAATRIAPRATSEHGVAVASGMVAGEAIAACAAAVLAAWSGS